MSNNNIKKEKPLVITYLTNLNFYFFQWQFNQILSTQGEPVGRKGRIESRRRRRGKGERWRRRRVERVRSHGETKLASRTGRSGPLAFALYPFSPSSTSI